MAKTLIISGQTYTNVAGFKATDSNDTVQTYIQPEGSTTITSNGTVDVTAFASAIVNIPLIHSITTFEEVANNSGITAVITTDTSIRDGEEVLY